MTYELKESEKGVIAVASFEEGEKINSYQDFFDLIMGSPAETTAVSGSRVPREFFDLKSGFAGEILQKVSTYRRRLILEGDFGSIDSKSLQDFIRESNRTGKVVFADSLDKAVALLK